MRRTPEEEFKEHFDLRVDWEDASYGMIEQHIAEYYANMTQTPSPHRFLSGRRRREQSPPKKQNTSSALRHELPEQQATTPQRSAVIPNTSQFAQTPRFSFGRPAATTSKSHSPPPPSLTSALKLSTRPTEDVASDDDEMLLVDQPPEVLPSIESTRQGYTEEAWAKKLPYSPKRRKLEEHSLMTNSPARPVFKKPPTAPASALTSDPHRSTQASGVVGSTGEEISTIRRPAFLRSSIAPPAQHEPLPEAFSPHRRGEKFVAGGMAATLQQWVIEAGQSAVQSRRGLGYLRGEDYVLRVRIEAINGRGPMLALGKQSDGAETRLLLVVDAKKDAMTDVPLGSIVAIRAPTWDVEVDGQIWTVGVDWKVSPQQ